MPTLIFGPLCPYCLWANFLNMAILEQLVIYHIKHICVGANSKQGEIPCNNMNNEQT